MHWKQLEHPPYSPDLSLCDYHLFGPLKKALAGERFEHDEEVKQFVQLFWDVVLYAAYGLTLTSPGPASASETCISAKRKGQKKRAIEPKKRFEGDERLGVGRKGFECTQEDFPNHPTHRDLLTTPQHDKFARGRPIGHILCYHLRLTPTATFGVVNQMKRGCMLDAWRLDEDVGNVALFNFLFKDV
ncbi:hypothetical protein NQ318_000595 [Aromia moschata]|uniref:Transposase n=1 Tax=Aromia moschata TaxID=1265417 RepID=A0AAV8XQT5_9CUCU|nr:hypothetical protein NQ318_000595 [Aromia moschata]